MIFFLLRPHTETKFGEHLDGSSPFRREPLFGLSN